MDRMDTLLAATLVHMRTANQLEVTRYHAPYAITSLLKLYIHIHVVLKSNVKENNKKHPSNPS